MPPQASISESIARQCRSWDFKRYAKMKKLRNPRHTKVCRRHQSFPQQRELQANFTAYNMTYFTQKQIQSPAVKSAGGKEIIYD